MISGLLLLAILCMANGFKPCEPFGVRIFYGQVAQGRSTNDKLHIYFNTASECSRSYVQAVSSQGQETPQCTITPLELSKEVNFYSTYVHKCKLLSINFDSPIYYNVYGWDGGSSKPIPFTDAFITVKIPDLTDKNRKINLIVLADWSYLETTRYVSIDKLLNTITNQNQIHGLLINGDIAYDLVTNNCKKYESFIVMLSTIARSIPVMFATGNHEYATEENYRLYQQSFEMYEIDHKFASGIELGSVFLAPFDPYRKVYNEDIDIDPAFANYQAVLNRASKTGRFIVSSSHYPMACSGSDENCVRIPIKLQKYWDAMFESKVSLYFGAHDHSYQRMFPLYRDGTFSRKTSGYNTEDDYIISIVEGVAGNDEGIVEEIDAIKDITASYTVNETGLGLLEVETTKVTYTHYSTKRGKTDQVIINRIPSRNLIRN